MCANGDAGCTVRTVSRLDAPTSGCMVHAWQRIRVCAYFHRSRRFVQVLPLRPAAEAALTGSLQNSRTAAFARRTSPCAAGSLLHTAESMLG